MVQSKFAFQVWLACTLVVEVCKLASWGPHIWVDCIWVSPVLVKVIVVSWVGYKQVWVEPQVSWEGCKWAF